MQNNLPQHIAIIMDGNGRWAKQNGLPRVEGHAKGAQVIDEIVEECSDIGVRFLTLYAFSEENWNRPDNEVASLMNLLKNYLIIKKPKMKKQGIRFLVIGDLDSLSNDLRKEALSTMKETATCKKMTLIVALSYGSRQEICRAVNKLISQNIKEINIEDISNALDTKEVPDPDFLIRTSGENRISNFLLWQMAYTELYFTDLLWPDFNKIELMKAIKEYQRRERRFGKTSEQL